MSESVLRACNFIKKKFQHRYFSVKFAKFLRKPILNSISEQRLLYLHYNPHHHYHYHHIHYHCKMHFYRLRIVLTNPLDFNMIPWLFRHIFFSSLVPSFLFFTHSKRTQISFTTTRQLLKMFSLYLYLYLRLFTLACLYLFKLTYLYVLFIRTFSLYYYINLIKLLKYGEYRSYDEIF